MYHLQREEFLPSAYAMIVSVVAIILAVVIPPAGVAAWAGLKLVDWLSGVGKRWATLRHHG